MMQVPPSAFPAYPPPTQEYGWAQVPPPPIISLAPVVQPEPAPAPIQANPIGESDEEKLKREGKRNDIRHRAIGMKVNFCCFSCYH